MLIRELQSLCLDVELMQDEDEAATGVGDASRLGEQKPQLPAEPVAVESGCELAEADAS